MKTGSRKGSRAFPAAAHRRLWARGKAIGPVIYTIILAAVVVVALKREAIFSGVGAPDIELTDYRVAPLQQEGGRNVVRVRITVQNKGRACTGQLDVTISLNGKEWRRTSREDFSAGQQRNLTIEFDDADLVDGDYEVNAALEAVATK